MWSAKVAALLRPKSIFCILTCMQKLNETYRKTGTVGLDFLKKRSLCNATARSNRRSELNRQATRFGLQIFAFNNVDLVFLVGPYFVG